MFDENKQQHFFFWAFILLAVSIPLSKFTTTVSELTLVGGWLLSGNWKNKMQRIKQFPTALLLCSTIFLIFLFGLWNTSNFTYAFKDLSNKLPLLIIPLILISIPTFSSQKVKQILLTVVMASVASALLGYGYYQYRISEGQVLDYRHLSPFISHIRLSLLLCFSIALIIRKIWQSSSKTKWLYLLPVLFILYYLNLLHSLTSFVILGVIGLFTVLFLKPWKNAKWIGILGSVLILVGVVFWSVKIYESYQEIFKPSAASTELKSHTLNGNPYYHNHADVATENGNKVGLYLCTKELEKEWPLISKVPLDSLINDYPMRVNLIRYMTSLNLKKDSVGLHQLSSSDIKAIEKGIANQFYVNHSGLEVRLHQSLWEVKKWQEGQRTTGSSVTMRLFFWNNALKIFKNNFWTGVGTGDVEDEIIKQYHQSTYANAQKIWRTHNQFLTVAISTGVVGLIVFIVVVFYPFINYKGPLTSLYSIVGIILIASMIWEDTLETQAGVLLFSLLMYLPYITWVKSTEEEELEK